MLRSLEVNCPFTTAAGDYDRARGFTEMVVVSEQVKAEEDAFFAHVGATELLRDYCGAVQYAFPQVGFKT